MNNFKRSVVYFTLLAYIAAWPSIAYGQEISSDGDYVTVKEGEAAPYDGFLFDSTGLIKLITNKSLELDKLKIEKDNEINKLNIEIEFMKKQHSLELKINTELNDNLMKLKNERIKLLEDNNKWHDLKLFGALFLGIVLSVTIFFVSVQVTNTKTP